jgi:L-rhamnose-H+ transport protein
MGIFEGLLLTLLAGSMAGGNLLPLKWIQVWKWENFWLVYSIVSLTIVPFSLAFLFLPHLATVYASTPPSALFKPLLYGLLWGIAQLGAGICVDKIGLALTSSILNGLCATFGSLTPLVVQHSEMLSQLSGHLLLVGIAVMLIGVILCGWAGLKREQAQTRSANSARSGMTYLLVMVLVVVSGLLAALLNIALAFGGGIVKLAEAQGAASTWAVFAVWPIALTGGLIVNLGYSIVLLSRNKTWANFFRRPAEAGNPIMAGSLWMLAIALYSSGTVLLGILGVSVGWALFQITTLLTGNLAGIGSGEWRSISRPVFNVNLAGVAVLLLATVIMAIANYSAVGVSVK